MTERLTALRGPAIDFRDDPFQQPAAACFTYYEDALILIEGATIKACGPYTSLRPSLPDGVAPVEYPGAILTAGLIDTHVHYPQVEMMGAYGEQLLAWLEKYTFPAE